MRPSLKLSILLIVGSITTVAQDRIDVTEQTIKIKASDEEYLHFGFAAGDQLIFSFKEVDGKEVKEVEVIEYPSTSKFADFKTSKIAEKVFRVTKNSIYKFRFYNGSMTGRVCRIKIQRIPASDATLNFDTSVRWEVKSDTTWRTYTRDVVIGYDTTRVQVLRRELVRVDTLVKPIFDKVLRVHSSTSGQSQFTYATVELPANIYEPNRTAPLMVIETLAWSYWLGVDQKALEDYNKTNDTMASGITQVGNLTGYGALASLAVTGISLFQSLRVGENVRFKFYGIQGTQAITIDEGNVISASGRNERITQGSFNIELYNDNLMQGLNVTIKMVAMQVSKTWADIPKIEARVMPRIEKQIMKEPVIQSKKILVHNQ